MMSSYKVTMVDGKGMTMLDQDGADINEALRQLNVRFGTGRVLRIVDMNNPNNVLCAQPEGLPNVLDA